jgi:hypothetical protein
MLRTTQAGLSKALQQWKCWNFTLRLKGTTHLYQQQQSLQVQQQLKEFNALKHLERVKQVEQQQKLHTLQQQVAQQHQDNQALQAQYRLEQQVTKAVLRKTIHVLKRKHLKAAWRTWKIHADAHTKQAQQRMANAQQRTKALALFKHIARQYSVSFYWCQWRDQARDQVRRKYRTRQGVARLTLTLHKWTHLQLRRSFSTWSRINLHWLRQEHHNIATANQHIQLETALELEQHARARLLDEEESSRHLEKTTKLLIFLANRIQWMLDHATRKMTKSFRQWVVVVQGQRQREEQAVLRAVQHVQQLLFRTFHVWQQKCIQANSQKLISTQVQQQVQQQVQHQMHLVLGEQEQQRQRQQRYVVAVSAMVTLWNSFNKRQHTNQLRRTFTMLMRNVVVHSLSAQQEIKHWSR